MIYSQLRSLMKNRPTFRLEDLHSGRTAFAHERVQISHWVNEKKLIRLKRGLYSLSLEERKGPLSALSVAEPLYRPSYISLAWTLSSYGLIPEAVGPLTCVTTLKTARFTNPLGTFLYQHVHPRFFFGFVRKEGEHPHWLALPEKALLDFIHLAIPKSEPLTDRLLVNGYRLQNLHAVLNARRLRSFAKRFSTPRVRQGAILLLRLLGQSHD